MTTCVLLSLCVSWCGSLVCLSAGLYDQPRSEMFPELPWAVSVELGSSHESSGTHLGGPWGVFGGYVPFNHMCAGVVMWNVCALVVVVSDEYVCLHPRALPASLLLPRTCLGCVVTGHSLKVPGTWSPLSFDREVSWREAKASGSSVILGEKMVE